MHDISQEKPHSHSHSHDHQRKSRHWLASLRQSGSQALGWLGKHWKLALLLAVGLYTCTGIYYVPADQQAVRLRFGRFLPGTVPPGLHYGWPYPIGEVIRLKINEAQRLSIGGDDLSRALAVTGQEPEGYLLTGDQNLVRIQAWIQYYIKDPASYLFRTRDLGKLLESAFLRCMTRAAAHRNVDEILTTGRIALQNEVQKGLQDECDRLDLGVALTTVALEEVRPPEEVRAAFLEVANAREDRNRIVHEARGYANALIPQVRGEAAETLQQAEIYRTELVNRAQGEGEGFLKVWSEYRNHPQVTRARLFLETVDEVLPRIRKVILDDQGSKEGLDLDIFQIQKK